MLEFYEVIKEVIFVSKHNDYDAKSRLLEMNREVKEANATLLDEHTNAVIALTDYVTKGARRYNKYY